MSGRRPPGGAGRLDPLVEIDPDRVATAVVGCGVALAVGALAFGGFVPTGRVLVSLLYPLAALLPVIGVAIVGYALRWLWLARRSDDRAPLADDPPETADTRATKPVGRDLNWRLTAAVAGWYRCEGTESAADAREILVDGAVHALTRSCGLDAGAAGEALRSGTWTDDPVAAAFLATERRQPLDERLRGMIDPGAAYERRVRRTIDAIESIDGAERLDSTGPSRPIDDEPTGGTPPGPNSRTERDDAASRRDQNETDARTTREVVR